MSTFYGQLKGSAKTIATRRGTNNSNIEASIQSWNGSLTNRFYYNDNEELCVEVQYSNSSQFGGYTAYNGTFKEYLNKLGVK